MGTAGTLKTFGILVVEPTPSLLAMLRGARTALGAREVLSADGVAGAMAVMDLGTTDIILTEWQLADGSGLDLVKAVRAAKGATRSTPIVMVTGNTRASAFAQAQAAGVNSYIVKPLNVRSLATHLRDIIEHPRPFIKAAAYAGPDRRRRLVPLDAGQDRRRP
jgi:two-component system chemotaxis response regulator CheY